CKLIKTAAQLQAIQSNPGGVYCLANDIDLASISNFTPIDFFGRFYGNGHVIRNLTINNSTATGLVGLFGNISDAVVQDLGVVNANVTATGNFASAGILAGM